MVLQNKIKACAIPLSNQMGEVEVVLRTIPPQRPDGKQTMTTIAWH
jgi:hypothetical protein